VLIITGEIISFNKSNYPEKETIDAQEESVRCKKLVKMVKEEAHQQEIMKAFGFQTAAQVKAAYFRALVESGEVPGIKGGRAAAKLKRQSRLALAKEAASLFQPRRFLNWELGGMTSSRFGRPGGDSVEEDIGTVISNSEKL